MQLSLREASRLLKVGERTLARWIEQRALPAYRVNGQWRFHRAELLEWATARKLPVASDLYEISTADGEEAPSLARALEAGGVHHDVPGDDKPSVLKEVVARLALPPTLDREFLWSVLLAREALGSTGVGDGIAIPHVRNPIVLQVARPIVSLCFLAQPIDFGALDGQPVHTLFSLVSPTVKAHLHLLSRLAFMLRDPRFRATLGRRAGKAEVLDEARRVEEALARTGEPA